MHDFRPEIYDESPMKKPARAQRTLLAISAAITFAMVSVAVAATPDCKMVRIAELPVRLARNKLIIDGAVNGQPVGIMIDTGSNITLMMRPAALRLGLTLQEVRGHRMFGIGGETLVQATVVDEFKLGQSTRKAWRMIVAGEHDFGDDVAVILGEDFLRQVDVEFDLAHSAIRLYQPKDCDGVSLAYWAPNGSDTVELEAIYDARPQIIVPVEINGHPLRALLDSGATASVVDMPDAARLGLTPTAPGVVAAGKGTGFGKKSVDHWIAPLQSFLIGDEITKNPTILFGDLWKDTAHLGRGSHVQQKVRAPSMLLGADFLRAHRVLISHSQRKVYFTYVGGPVFQQRGLPQPGRERDQEKMIDPGTSEK